MHKLITTGKLKALLILTSILFTVGACNSSGGGGAKLKPSNLAILHKTALLELELAAVAIQAAAAIQAAVAAATLAAVALALANAA